MKTPLPLAFVETSVFVRKLSSLGLEEPLHALQGHLLEDPAASDLEPGTGGLRMVRIGNPGRGKSKRSGARIHYLWLPSVSLVYFLSINGKDDSESLSTAQKQQLRVVVEAIKQEWTDGA